jgi:hypothetical protein
MVATPVFGGLICRKASLAHIRNKRNKRNKRTIVPHRFCRQHLSASEYATLTTTSSEHEARPKPKPFAELCRDVIPVLDQKVHELPAIHQPDARESLLERHVGSGFLKICRRDEGALPV